MQTIQCPACQAVNRLPAPYCMRCGKQIPPPDSAPSRHARAFAERERMGPFFGAFPDALDFSLASLAKMDALLVELWGEQGMAPGRQDWQPDARQLPMVVNFGAYLGEVLCRALPARWEVNPTHPEVVIAARVVDAKGTRINPFAQIGARLRDGAASSMASLYSALSGHALAPWRIPDSPPTRPAAPVTKAPAPAAPVRPEVDVPALFKQAAEHSERGHYGNAIQSLRQVLAVQPALRSARRDLVLALAQAGALEEALKEVDALKQAQADPEWSDLRAMILMSLGRGDDALGMLDMALMKVPGDLRLRRRRAHALLHLRRWPRAEAELRSLMAEHPDAELGIGLAHALAEQGKREPAIAQLEQLLNGALPGRSAEIVTAAREKLAVLRTPPIGADAVARPSTPLGGAAAAYAAAIEHARNRRFDQALPLFQQAAGLEPTKAAYAKDVGNCLNDLGHVAEAAEWFERCLGVDPGYSQARWSLGVLEEKRGRRDAAIVHYRQLLARLDSDQRDVDRAFARLQALGALPQS